MYELDWERYFYPYYGSTITLSSELILWREYDKSYPSLSNRPTFYGSNKTASGYAEQPNKILGTFMTTRPIKLIDVRYLKILLKQLLDEHKNTKLTQNDINIIKAVTISYGICSLKHQLNLIHEVYGKSVDMFKGFESLDKYYMSRCIKQKDGSYKEPVIEENGVRIAETTIDAYTSGFIKILFEDICDGIISPRLHSPFHIEKDGTMSPELILFSPKDILTQITKVPSKILSVPINGIILQSNRIFTTKTSSQMDITFYMKGGSNNNNKNILNDFNDFNELIEKGDKKYIYLYNKGVEIGRRWKNKNKIITEIEPITPQHKISLFMENT